MKNLKLNVLANQNLSGKEMNSLKGGGEPGKCCCGCMYADQGGSSFNANDSANNAEGLRSPNCLPDVVITNPEGKE